MPKYASKFLDSWLNIELHPEFSGWLTKTSDGSARCKICSKDVNIANMGRKALLSHMASAKHQASAQALSGQQNITSLFAVPRCSAPPASGPTSESVSPVASPSLPSPGSSQSPLAGMSISPEVTRAEITWCLKSVYSHLSRRAADGLPDLFQAMFPDSPIANQFTLGRDKVSYGTVYGLAPYLLSQLRNRLSKCDAFVVMFDEALNRISQRGQMDLVVRFWDSDKDRVCTRYLSSSFMGRSRASDLLSSFKQAMEGLPMSRMLQISMDGPSVNWKFLRDLELDLQLTPSDPRLLETGTCGLHIVNGAFTNGHTASGWNINGFLKAIHRLFKDSPARRSEFSAITQSAVFPLKFCSIRWTENGRVADRALEVLPHIKKWCAEVHPKPTIPTFDFLSRAVLNDALLPAKLQFFKGVAKIVEPFLVQFQSSNPLFPFLYECLEEIIRTLMSRVVKPDIIGAANSVPKLLKIDLNPDAGNLRPKPDPGFGAIRALELPNATERQRVSFYGDCRSFYVKMIQKLLERSPLAHYKVVRASSSLSPELLIRDPKTCITRFDALLGYLVERTRLSDEVADRAKVQFPRLLRDKDVVEALRAFRRDSSRLDEMYSNIFRANTGFEDVYAVARLVLILSHGNAAVEGGFSVNKDMLVENLTEQSLVAQRLVYDAVHEAGGPLNVNINGPMMRAFRKARSAYRAALEKRRAEAAEKTKSDVQARKRLVSDLEEVRQKRRAILHETKEQEAELAAREAQLKMQLNK